MRRRHAAEPETSALVTSAEPAAEPFHFEVEEERQDEFAAPFLEEQPAPQPEIPLILESEPLPSEPQLTDGLQTEPSMTAEPAIGAIPDQPEPQPAVQAPQIDHPPVEQPSVAAKPEARPAP